MGRKARKERVLGTEQKTTLHGKCVGFSVIRALMCVGVTASLFLLSLTRISGPIGAGDFGQPIGVGFSLSRSGKFRAGSEIDEFPDKR